MKTINLRKVFPKNATMMYLVISLILMAILFFFTYFNTKDLFLSSTLSVVFGILFFPLYIIGEILGKKRHYSIIESKSFKELLNSNFNIKEVNAYRGLSGVYNGYLFDIYYDWSSHVKFKVNRAVVFNVYFIPPVLNSGKTNHAKLKALSEKYDISIWSFKSYSFWWREGNIIMKNAVGIFNPSYKKLIERMDIVVNILKTEELKPVDKKTLNVWRKASSMDNIPEIELYHKQKITNDRT
jgi:hypothetical protein